MRRFDKSFTQQEPIDETAIAAAVAVLRSGRLHRYNTDPGEAGETALLEQEFADYLGLPYCLACASGGYAIHVALRSAGLKPGEPVLCNAHTLSPVPGAIHNAGGHAVLVDIDDNSRIDLADLEAAAIESGARILLLSHMRGHIADMHAIVALCKQHNIILIEDCAHTMGAQWRGQPSGTFGQIACFSVQTYKHINAGEGGFLVTADADIMRRAVMHSGAYMLYHKHLAAPPPETFEQIRLTTPNYSARMDNLRAAILRPQLAKLDENCARWTKRYRVVEAGLARFEPIRLFQRAPEEAFVGSSIQFVMPGFTATQMKALVADCAERGIPVKWFGAELPDGYTSRFDSWQFLGPARPLPNTKKLLATLCDVRIPLTFELADCELIAELIGESVTAVNTQAAAS